MNVHYYTSTIQAKTHNMKVDTDMKCLEWRKAKMKVNLGFENPGLFKKLTITIEGPPLEVNEVVDAIREKMKKQAYWKEKPIRSTYRYS